jgi:hypothetical protein
MLLLTESLVFYTRCIPFELSQVFSRQNLLDLMRRYVVPEVDDQEEVAEI